MKKKHLMAQLALEQEANKLLRLRIASAERNLGFFKLLLKIGPRKQQAADWWISADEYGNPYIEIKWPGSSLVIDKGDTMTIGLPFAVRLVDC